MSQLTPVQGIVLSHVNAQGAVCIADMRAYLEQKTRYVGYTLERAALELVEAGVLVQEGNLLMVADTQG